MSCLTPEELAGIALDPENRAPPPHVNECDACSAKLAALSDLSDQLSALHAELHGAHDTSRENLMAQLAGMAPRAPSRRWPAWATPGSPLLSARQRLAIGGAGLLAVVAIVAVSLTLGGAERASAMERMLAKLREVTSFQYSLHDTQTFTREDAEEPATVEFIGTVWWRAPNSVSEVGLIYEYPANTPPGERKPQLKSRFAAVHPDSDRGIIIDHLREYVRWTPGFDGEFGADSPATRLRMVAEGSGEMLRDLGTRVVDGVRAHGFVMRLDGAAEDSGFDALEVWVDPDTDLPLEVSHELEADWGARRFRMFDCRWNIDIPPHVFTLRAPEGYVDTTPPNDKEALDAIAAALRTYAELSGGHYPRVEHFYGDAVRAEMLEMAGLAESSEENGVNDATSLRIKQATVGLDWLTRVLRNPHLAGYFGETVDADDRDKVLLWWATDFLPESYRIFYGDLTTEIVEGDWFERLRDGQSPRGPATQDQ